ncbi:uncharacterized protein N7482_002721 [Penicillium canariense]|uniref:Uncharacterized protein n=1 Tax=Penicillium canariense TaxID=189055 RepID=A0A9W9IG02_9EURO|nr:uncharacterized protein N7482_002721 [Penicillium canariense]KAJ5176844.1 hypothetical protein N7482_002721 [Penicillium canariense]
MARSTKLPTTPPPPHESTSIGGIESKETRVIDLTMSSDEEQGPAKRIMLAKDGPAKKPILRAPVKGEAATATPADIAHAVEYRVDTPPATSPPVGSHEAPFVLPDEAPASASCASSPTDSALSRSPARCGWDKSYTADLDVFAPGEPDIEYWDGLGTYTDVHWFVEYIETVMDYIPPADIQRNLQNCLRREARTWYDNELTDKERSDLRHLHVQESDGWFDMLTARFHGEINHDLEMMKFRARTFTWDDVRHDSPIEYFLQNMYRYARFCFDEHWEKLHAIWEQIDPTMRKDIPEPNELSRFQPFLTLCEKAEAKWRYMV